MDKFSPGERLARANFSMPRGVYERFKAMPVRVHVAFALSTAQKGNTLRMALPMHDVAVAGFGMCTPETGFAERPDEISGIVCRSALGQPVLTLVQIAWSYEHCDVAPARREGGVQGAAWMGKLNQNIAEFNVAPVWAGRIDFTNSDANYQGNQPRHMCPGTPIAFTPYSLTGRTQAAFSVEGFQLPKLSRVMVGVIENP